MRFTIVNETLRQTILVQTNIYNDFYFTESERTVFISV